MGPRISTFPRIGTSPSTITVPKPNVLVRPLARPPGWPHHTTTARPVLRLIHSPRRNYRKLSSDHTTPALSLHMAASPTLDSIPIRPIPLACRNSHYTTSPIYTTPCRSSSSSSSNNSNHSSNRRYRVWQNTMACFLYSVAHSSLRGLC